MIEKICEKCGTAFNCKHSADCWCVKYSIDKQLGMHLREKYKDCLCKNCLEDYIEKANNNLPYK